MTVEVIFLQLYPNSIIKYSTIGGGGSSYSIGTGTIYTSGYCSSAYAVIGGVTFTATNTPQAYTVSSGVTSLSVDLCGSPGGGSNGGKGARVQSTISCQPGQQFEVNVGSLTYGGGGAGQGGNTFL